MQKNHLHNLTILFTAFKKNQQIKFPQSDEKKWHWMCFNEDDPIIL